METILVIDDDRTILEMIAAALEDEEVEVLTATDAEDGLARIRNDEPDVVLLDIMLPELSGLEAFQKIRHLDSKLPTIFITGSGNSDTAIEAMKLGAYDYLLKPLDLKNVRDVVTQALKIRRMMKVEVGVRQAVSPDDKGDHMIGRSKPMQEVFKAIGRVASQDVTVLIEGESGTGKELVARAIYQHSKRNEKPFLAINCAAIPENLLESELFGHEQGAFTGGDRRRIGKFEQCSGGTIFLDEIGDMPATLQSKILRLLQDQTFERVGGNETIKTDVRLIAATNCDLQEMVEEGTFREDLYYRLNVFPICLPPLREREDDLVLLIEHFLAQYNRDLDKSVEGIAPDALKLLQSYRWPGNIREVQSVIRQAIIQTPGPVITTEFLPKDSCDDMLENDDSCVSLSGDNGGEFAKFVDRLFQQESEDMYAQTVEYVERYLLTRVLQETGGNQSQAAKMLGITRGSLRNKIRSLGLSIDQVVRVDQANDETDVEAVT